MSIGELDHNGVCQQYKSLRRYDSHKYTYQYSLKPPPKPLLAHFPKCFDHFKNVDILNVTGHTHVTACCYNIFGHHYQHSGVYASPWYPNPEKPISHIPDYHKKYCAYTHQHLAARLPTCFISSHIGVSRLASSRLVPFRLVYSLLLSPHRSSHLIAALLVSSFFR